MAQDRKTNSKNGAAGEPCVRKMSLFSLLSSALVTSRRNNRCPGQGLQRESREIRNSTQIVHEAVLRTYAGAGGRLTVILAAASSRVLMDNLGSSN